MRTTVQVASFTLVAGVLGLVLVPGALLRCAGDTDGCATSGRDTAVAVIQAVGVLAAIGSFDLQARRSPRWYLWRSVW